MTYVLVLCLIGFLILIHELGHLWAAHAVGIPVKRFSIGFGPKLFGWRRRGTEYWVAWFPLGGYVMPAAESEVEFLGIDVWRRIVFSLGGPAANVLFAVAIFGSVNILQHGWSLSGAFVAPWGQTIGALNSFLLALPELFRQPGELSGVVGIVAIGNKVVGAGAVETMGFMLALTLSLAVLNMLPIPPLDGGRIVINVLEKLHPKAARLHVPLAIVGWFGLIGLMMYTTYADIAKHVIG